MASPSSGPGNRPSDFMRYACESCVGVFRERKRTREFVYVAPYRIGHPSSTAPGQETKTRTHVIPPCSGIMGAAHGVRIEAKLNSRPPPHPASKTLHGWVPPARLLTRTYCIYKIWLRLMSIPFPTSGMSTWGPPHIYVQDLEDVNLTGTQGMAGAVIIGFRKCTYRQIVQAWAWGCG